jgi:AraC family transcriptional regulator
MCIIKQDKNCGGGPMEHYLLKILEDTTDYIELHLRNELTLDSISANVNITKFHLLRIWKGAAGTGLMEYVRRRRIASSLVDLLSPLNTITFIADKYGFGSERTFNRIFKEEFDTTPAKWRKNPIALNILDRFNADFMSRAGEGLIYLKSIMVLPTFSLAGITYEVDIEDNRDNDTANRLAVEFFYQHRTKVLNPVAKDIYYGFTKV